MSPRPAASLPKALLLAALVSSGAETEAPPQYELDATWSPAFPAGTDLYSAVAVSGDRVFVVQRSANFTSPVLVLDKEGNLLTSWGGDDRPDGTKKTEIGKLNGTWGSHGLSVQPANASAGRPEDTVWIMDFFNHQVLSYSLDGEFLGKAGRSDNRASFDAGGFGSVSDAVFWGGSAFFADGDGGEANRVERWEAASGVPGKVEWVWPPQPPSQRKNETYLNPHGIAYHQRSGLLLVADREHGRIVAVDPETGEPEGELRCKGLKLGPKFSNRSAPFGVRTLRWGSWDLLLVAASDSPADQKNQFVHVVDMESFSRGSLACKAVLQSVAVPPPGKGAKGEPEGNTPHLIGVDEANGDLYLSCIAQPGSTILRLRQRDRGGSNTLTMLSSITPQKVAPFFALAAVVSSGFMVVRASVAPGPALIGAGLAGRQQPGRSPARSPKPHEVELGGQHHQSGGGDGHYVSLQ